MKKWKSNAQDISGWGVLITGATSGIGEAIAWQFAEKKCKIAITGRRKERLDKLKQDICQQLHRKPEDVVAIQQDVTKIDELESLPGKIPFNVDILVNNAGVARGMGTPVDLLEIADIQKVIQCNVVALMTLSRIFVEGMKARGRGHIINISSIAGSDPCPGGSLYCGSKHAVDAFTKSAIADLGPTPVKFTSISPGCTETEIWDWKPEMKAVFFQNMVILDPADIADNVVYAATRPPHVQICDIRVFPTNQSSCVSVHKVGPSLGAPSGAKSARSRSRSRSPRRS